MWKLLEVVYFALTTISTVGYGDRVPVSKIERIFVIFIMLGGVYLFSYIMSMFMEMVRDWKISMGVVNKSEEL